MPSVEYWYNEQTLIVAEINEHDDSFDHALGVERRYTYDVGEFSVISYGLGVDVDITKSISDSLLNILKEWVVEKYLSQLR